MSLYQKIIKTAIRSGSTLPNYEIKPIQMNPRLTPAHRYWLYFRIGMVDRSVGIYIRFLKNKVYVDEVEFDLADPELFMKMAEKFKKKAKGKPLISSTHRADCPRG